MKITKSILIIGVASSLMLSCKDTASNTTSKGSIADAQKENTVALKPETASFKIEGMTCAMGCAKTIETKLSKTNGVKKAVVDFDKKEATVEFDAAAVTSQKLTEIVQSTGDGATYKVVNMKTKSKV